MKTKKAKAKKRKPRARASSARARDDADQFTLHHADLKVGATTYRVFLRVPTEELDVVTSAAVAAHLTSKKPVIVAVRAHVKELRDPKLDQYKEES